jgi:hypothetical protein
MLQHLPLTHHFYGLIYANDCACLYDTSMHASLIYLYAATRGLSLIVANSLTSICRVNKPWLSGTAWEGAEHSACFRLLNDVCCLSPQGNGLPVGAFSAFVKSVNGAAILAKSGRKRRYQLAKLKKRTSRTFCGTSQLLVPCFCVGSTETPNALTMYPRNSTR